MAGKTFREYAHPALLAATGLLLVVGVVLFWTAASFEAYITALLAMAVAALCFEGRRELQAKDKRRDGGGPDAAAGQALASHDPEH